MAKKEPFYFSHDHNARNDRKIAPLVKDYKSAGYGIYWCTAEMMHEEGGELDFDDITIYAISKDLNEESSFVKEVIDKCISKYKLFVIIDDKITAGRVKRNLSNISIKSKIKSDAGRLGGIKSGESRKSKQNEAVLQADEAELEANELKEIKGNEKKRKEIYNKGEDFVDFNFLGLGRMKVNFYSQCESWQLKEINEFLTNSQSSFEAMAMSNPVLNNLSNFNIALQEFINMIQGSNDYKESQELRRYFRNWIEKKNGTLESFLISSKNKGNGKKSISSFL